MVPDKERNAFFKEFMRDSKNKVKKKKKERKSAHK
jgi:hypothetical protein